MASSAKSRVRTEVTPSHAINFVLIAQRHMLFGVVWSRASNFNSLVKPKYATSSKVLMLGVKRKSRLDSLPYSLISDDSHLFH